MRYLIILFFFLVGCSENATNSKSDSHNDSEVGIKSSNQTDASDEGSDGELNRGLFCEYLEDPLWSERDAYDATHMLMIPLEFAFEFNDEALLSCFSSYIENLENAVSEESWEMPGRLNWIQHLHLIARYYVLSNDIDGTDWVLSEFQRFWSDEPAWLWARDPFDGIKERIEWKLRTSDEDIAQSYYNVIFDEDYFTLSLGIDLYGLYYRADRLDECPGCVEAKDFFKTIFNDRVEWDGDGWLIDIGRWRDHRDYAYASYYREPISLEGETLSKQLRNDVVTDSSHALRYPSWLRSAQLSLDEDASFINKLQDGLKFQFMDSILVTGQGTVPMLNNFMDGENGWFRYNYASHQGALNGYGPYSLSGSFALGWWSLLGGKAISEEYERLVEAFPLDEAELQLYSGSSTREQHPLINDKWHNGMMKSIAHMSSALSLSRM